jgi:hypothetical protein
MTPLLVGQAVVGYVPDEFVRMLTSSKVFQVVHHILRCVPPMISSPEQGWACPVPWLF